MIFYTNGKPLIVKIQRFFLYSKPQENESIKNKIR